ncbi:MAG: hypothetical protein GY788_23615 [bacterium]|nr:hypothetical protein [bacterium]
MMLLNEVGQWIVLAVVLFLLLGLFRHVSDARLGEHDGLEESSGPGLGAIIPSSLQSLVSGYIPTTGLLSIAFITEGCSGCQQFLSTVESLESIPAGNRLVIVVLRPSPNYLAALEALPVPCVEDDGTVWRDCQIVATPFVVHFDKDLTVLGKEIQNDAGTLFSHVQ